MILSRSKGSAEMRRREILLTVRSGLLDKAYTEAENYICNMEPKVYNAFLSKLLCEAVCDRVNEEAILTENGEEKSDGAFEISFNKKDLENNAKQIIADADEMISEKGFAAPKIRIAKEPVNIGGGFILRLGDVETDCSVKTLVAAARVNSEADCAKVLFQ